MDQHYEIELVADDKSTQAVAPKCHRKPLKASALPHPGFYCLRSSETDWDEEKLWRPYIMLTDLAVMFRSLKFELGLRPVLGVAASRQAPAVFEAAP